MIQLCNKITILLISSWEQKWSGGIDKKTKEK